MGIGLGGASASMVAGAAYSLSALQPACCLHRPCAFIDAEPDAAPDPVLITELRGMIEHVGPFHAGEYIHRMGEPIQGVCEVRSGAVKTVVDDRDGGDQILGFTLPGDGTGDGPSVPDAFFSACRRGEAFPAPAAAPVFPAEPGDRQGRAAGGQLPG
ncbi:hypothetical protein G6F68_013708 [Rhizopus microsporus]|nr:hypothetical protein G6F68_013708 [Rhizopus microsporus]